MEDPLQVDQQVQQQVPVVLLVPELVPLLTVQVAQLSLLLQVSHVPMDQHQLQDHLEAMPTELVVLPPEEELVEQPPEEELVVQQPE